MIRKFFVLVAACLLFSQVEAAVDVPEVLYSFIEGELSRAKLDLDENTVSSLEEINNLKTNLDKIWVSIKEKGSSESKGLDKDLRAGYVTMQGIIELAISRALEKDKIDDVAVYIVTPRMPTPLMLKGGSGLAGIDLGEPQEFARYRNLILIELLRVGGVVNALYSHNAKSALLNEDQGFENYATYCEQNDNLIDSPVIKIDVEEFPLEMTGAMYLVDDLVITIESRQVTQIDDRKEQAWAIKFGKSAELRKREVDEFLGNFLSNKN